MRSGGALLVALAVTVVAAVGLVVAAVAGRPVPEVVEPATIRVFAPVESGEVDHNHAVDVTVAMLAAPRATGPGGPGLVTAVMIAPGDEVVDGAAVYARDGRTVTAYVSDTPFHRELRTGARGDDVAVLQRFLTGALGSVGEADGRFGAGTRSMLEEWQSLTGAVVTGVLDPTLMVRIDADFTVEDVGVQVGRPTPALGEPVLTGSPGLGEIAVEPTPAPGHYRLIVSGWEVALTFDGTTWAPATGPAEADLRALVLAVAPEAAGSADVRIDGRLALAEPVPTLIVPASALVGTADASCVWVADGQELRPVTVSVTGTTASGAVTVDSPGLAGETVLLDAGQHVTDRRCP